MSMFDTMAAGARAAHENTFGETITYTRSSTSISITAIRSEEEARGVTADGIYLKAVTLAFVFLSSSLGALSEPARGDTITDAAGRVYDVQADGVERIAETGELKIPVVEVL